MRSRDSAEVRRLYETLQHISAERAIMNGADFGETLDTDDLRADDGQGQRRAGFNVVQEVRISSSSTDEVGLLQQRPNSTRESVDLSPGFRSAAAMAGWDDDALFLAALNQSPVDSRSQVAATLQQTQECEAPCGCNSPACRDRKRDTRTPLSSARRHRRIRWQGGSGSPLERVPMKVLPLLSDNDEEDELCRSFQPASSSGSEGKENFHPGADAHDQKDTEGEGKLKEKTSSKPPYMDQLREELSCAVCLDICLEPSTISCGHSFCGACLQSVLKMCGPRCPKCRQPLRGEALRNCRINTVLWNTIQILFPHECAARLEEQRQRQRDEEEETAANLAKNTTSSSLGIRPARLPPWRSSSFSNTVNRISVMGTLRSSFQASAPFLGEDGIVGATRSSSAETQAQETIAQRSQSRNGRIRRARQEQVDAALAARLQQAELMMASDPEALPEESRQIGHHRSSGHNRPRYGTSAVAAAATNVRPVASRATRHRTRS